MSDALQPNDELPRGSAGPRDPGSGPPGPHGPRAWARGGTQALRLAPPGTVPPEVLAAHGLPASQGGPLAPANGAGAGADEDEDTLLQAWRGAQRLLTILRRRWPVAVLVTVLGCVATVARLSTLPPSFTSEGLLQVGMYNDLVTEGLDSGRGGQFSRLAANTHLRLLSSDKVVEGAFLILGRDLPPEGHRRAAFDGFRGQVQIEPIRDTFLVEVRSSGSDAEAAKERVNALMESFIPFSDDFVGERRELLDDELARDERDTKAELDRAHAERERLRQTYGAGDLSEEVEIYQTRVALLDEQFRGLERRRAWAKVDRERLEALLRDAEAEVTDSQPGELESLLGRAAYPGMSLQGGGAGSGPSGQEASYFQAAKAELQELRRKWRDAQAALRPNHPDYKQLALQVENREAGLRTEISEDVKVRLALLEVSDTADEQNQARVERELAEARQELEKLTKANAEILGAREQIRLLDQELGSIRDKRQIAAGKKIISTAQVISWAEPAGSPTSPFTFKTLFMAFLASLALGVGLVVAWDRVEDTISAEEGVRQLGLPILGRVPYVDLRKVRELDLLQDASHASRTAEAFRLIRTNLTFAAAGVRGSAILVTSGTASDGKSLTSTQLALALARGQGRALLIEGDMRRPRLQQILETYHDRGLSDLLAGLVTLDEAIQPTDFEDLDFLPSGPTPPNSADLLVRGHFERILEQALRRYDYVVVDSPPVVGIADTSLMAPYVKGVVHVVKLHHSRRRSAQAAIEQVEAVGARSLGAVVNGVTRHDAAYGYGYGYGYYRAYEADATTTAGSATRAESGQLAAVQDSSES